MTKLVNSNKINGVAFRRDVLEPLHKRCNDWLENHPLEKPVTAEELQALSELLQESAKLGAPAYALTGELYCRYQTLVSEKVKPAKNRPQRRPEELSSQMSGTLSSAISKRKQNEYLVTSPVRKPDLDATIKDSISKTMDTGFKKGL